MDHRTGTSRFVLNFRLTLASILLAATGMANAQVVITYQYDDLDRLESASRSDGPVVNYGFDVVSNLESITVTNSPDTDGDKLADFADEDDDNDGMPDTYELANGFDPLNASDANQDADGDGLSNLDEFLGGSDPNNPNDPVQIPIPLAALVLLAALIMLTVRRLPAAAAAVLVASSVLLLPLDAAAQTDGWASAQFTEEDGVTPAEAAANRRPRLTENAAARIQSTLAPLAATAASEYAAIATTLDNDPLRIYHYVRTTSSSSRISVR